jgi:signal peptidase I
MNRFFALLLIMILMLLIGCSHPITDSTTEMEIKGIDTPKASFIKEEVYTDGMLGAAEGKYAIPFGYKDEVWVDPAYYITNPPSRGDIVLFKTKANKDQNSDIARVIGLPGEKITITKGQIYINGNRLDTFYGKEFNGEKYIKDDKTSTTLKAATQLKENEYFVIGDVWWRSFNTGAISKADVQGKVVGFDIFNEAKAVAKVLKDHPDFPEAGKSIAVERIVGGPAPGSKVSGRATTIVAASTEKTQPNHDVYYVTLNREWNIKINGKQANGNWVYKVDRHNVELVKQEDNEMLLNTIK